MPEAKSDRSRSILETHLSQSEASQGQSEQAAATVPSKARFHSEWFPAHGKFAGTVNETPAPASAQPQWTLPA